MTRRAPLAGRPPGPACYGPPGRIQQSSAETRALVNRWIETKTGSDLSGGTHQNVSSIQASAVVGVPWKVPFAVPTPS